MLPPGATRSYSGLPLSRASSAARKLCRKRPFRYPPPVLAKAAFSVAPMSEPQRPGILCHQAVPTRDSRFGCQVADEPCRFAHRGLSAWLVLFRNDRSTSAEFVCSLTLFVGTHTGPAQRGCEFFVGCDKRSESNGRCAGAGNRQSSKPSGLFAALRAGTPRLPFGPLVTPYN